MLYFNSRETSRRFQLFRVRSEDVQQQLAVLKGLVDYSDNSLVTAPKAVGTEDLAKRRKEKGFVVQPEYVSLYIGGENSSTFRGTAEPR